MKPVTPEMVQSTIDHAVEVGRINEILTGTLWTERELSRGRRVDTQYTHPHAIRRIFEAGGWEIERVVATRCSWDDGEFIPEHYLFRFPKPVTITRLMPVGTQG